MAPEWNTPENFIERLEDLRDSMWLHPDPEVRRWAVTLTEIRFDLRQHFFGVQKGKFW